MIPNYKIAAHIVAQRGLIWLHGADARAMSAATDELLKERGISQDTRVAVTCLKAIREYTLVRHKNRDALS